MRDAGTTGKTVRGGLRPLPHHAGIDGGHYLVAHYDPAVDHYSLRLVAERRVDERRYRIVQRRHPRVRGADHHEVGFLADFD